MIEAVIRMTDCNVAYRSVVATRGKAARAEPVSALYEQGRVHHLGCFPELEDEMVNFTSDFDQNTSGYSPNRVDELVWAITDLMVVPMNSYGIYESYRQKAAALGCASALGIDNRVPWRREADRIANQSTPGHPDVPETDPEKIEYVSGPKMKPSFAIGSLEWSQQQTQDQE